MDSLTQFALGAAVGGAVLGRQAGPKALLWGGICGTLPDLDIFVPMGDPVSDFTYHRAVSHSVFFLTLAAPLIAVLMWRRHAELQRHRARTFWMVWLCLVTHPILDCLTVYGTQILLPFSDYPVTWSTVFIIDPAYTLPLAVALIAAWAGAGERWARVQRSCAIGLVASTGYLLATVVIKAHVNAVTRQALSEQRIAAERFLTTPAPFNTLLWRIVVMQPAGYQEGFYSLFDGRAPLRFEAYPSEPALLEPIADNWAVQRLQWFTKGFYRVREVGDSVAITDLRMGVEPFYVFSFRVGERNSDEIVAVPNERLATFRVPADSLAWTWRRIWEGPSLGPLPAAPGQPELALPDEWSSE